MDIWNTVVSSWNRLFSSDSFIPHGHCYLWQPGLVGLHLLSDALITLAYYSIPITLIYFVRRRSDLPFNRIFLLFCAFIIACGTTHLLEIWTLWYPTYWVSGLVKALTALVSVVTAIELIPIVPQALALPSPAQLQDANQALQEQIAERLRAEAELKQYQSQLEQLVRDRTAQLESSHQQMETILQREQEARSQAEQAKAEIQHYAERLTLALDAAKMGSWDWDIAQDEIFWTPQHEVIFGYEPGQSQRTYTDWSDRVHPEDLSRAEAALQAAIVSHSQFNCEYRIVLPESKMRWINSVGRIYVANGQPKRMIGMTIDITQRKQADEALQERAQQLAQVNRILAQTATTLKERNQELDQFAYVVSHDLKAPLRAIANLSEWLEEDLAGQLPEDNTQQLQLMRKRVYRMEALINGLLEYSRVGRAQTPIAQVNVGDLLEEVIDSLSPPATLHLSIAAGLPVLEARRLQLMQVFTNLIGNAIKHHDRPDGTVQVSSRDLGEVYEFSIADDGPGIDAQYHEKIFTIFQTLQSRDTHESTGIGLSIVKKIVETNGGIVTVESRVGQGATFRFTWPKQTQLATP